MMTEHDVAVAEDRMRERLKTTPHALKARYDRRVARIVVTLNSGLELAIPPHIVEGLANAKPADLMAIEISPTGLGLHFPALDADIYLPGLLEGVFGSAQWMAAGLGKLGGASKSAAKAQAARENGKRGGRPRKAAAG